jgi:hypothetical protein
MHKVLSAALVFGLSGVAGVLAYESMGVTELPTAGEDAAQPAGAPAAHPQAAGQPGAGGAPVEVLDWKALESGYLTRHLQLTSREKFIKAGEQYFNSDATWLIFQAVPVPAAGKEIDPFYSMYVAKILKDSEGHVTGLGEPVKVSPEGSANTCGWFHPTEPWRILFGSTITRPADDQKSGFQVGTRSYRWMFPEEMEIVTRNVIEIAEDVMPGCPMNPGIAAQPDAKVAMPMFSRPRYDAEASYSKDGRFVLYGRVREGEAGERADADIWLYDTQTRAHAPLVTEKGYDGGPFFSPDGKSICYRSDRKLNDELQLFIAELAFDEKGVPTGIAREKQLTDGSAVNWCPYWHPSGKLLVYASSEVSHMNYEVFAVEASWDKPIDAIGKRRVTQANGADVLPVFSNDGKYMVWCSQRGPKIAGEDRASSQIWIAECVPGGFDDASKFFSGR